MIKSLGLLVLGLIVGAWYAFVAWKLYGWFVIPLGAPSVGFLHMWGLTTFASVLMLSTMRSDGLPDDTRELVVAVLAKAIVAAMLLGGWVIQAVMA